MYILIIKKPIRDIYRNVYYKEVCVKYMYTLVIVCLNNQTIEN